MKKQGPTHYFHLHAWAPPMAQPPQKLLGFNQDAGQDVTNKFSAALHTNMI